MYTRLDPQRSRASESIALDIIDGRPWIASRIRNNNLKQHCHLLGRTFRSFHSLTDPLRPACRRLLTVIASRTGLLTEVHPSRMQLVPGLVRVAAYSPHWLRSPEDWQPDTTETPARQWRSLIAHLFEAWPVPDVFANAWWVKGDLIHPEREWFCHMAAGGSLRRAPGMPETVTDRECHLATQAPADLNIRQALLWARVRTLCGREALWNETLASPMARYFSMDAVWSRLLAKFSAKPEAGHHGLGLIADTLVALRHQDDGRHVRRLLALPLPELLAHARRFWAARLDIAREAGVRFRQPDPASAGVRRELHRLLARKWEPWTRLIPFENMRFGDWRWTVREVCDQVGLLSVEKKLGLRHPQYGLLDCMTGCSSFLIVSREAVDTGESGPWLMFRIDRRWPRVGNWSIRGEDRRWPQPIERRFLSWWTRANGISYEG